MKIEIHNPSNPSFSPNVFADNKKVSAPKRSICDPFGWSEDELELLLGDNKFDYLKKGHYTFNISANHFNLVTGKRPCKNTHEIKLLSKYGII